MTREQYLAWAKQRALEYLASGDIKNAVASMLSDMNKREDTKVNPALALFGLMVVSNDDWNEAKRFVEGFR